MGKKGPKKTLTWADHQKMTAKLLESQHPYGVGPKTQAWKNANFAKNYGTDSKTLMSILKKQEQGKVVVAQVEEFNKLMDEALQKQLSDQIAKDMDAQFLNSLVGKKVGELKYEELAKQIDKLTETMAKTMKVPLPFLITTQQSLTPTQAEYLKALQKSWGEKMAPLHKDWKKELLGVDYANGADQSIFETLKKTVEGLETGEKNFIMGKSSHKIEFKKLELPDIKGTGINSAIFDDLFYKHGDEDAKVDLLPTYSELEKLYAAKKPEKFSTTNPCSEVLFVPDLKGEEEKLKYALSPDAFTKDVFHSLRQKVQTWWGPKAMTRLAIKRYLTRIIPMCCPYIRDQDVSSPEDLDDYLQAVYHHHFGTQLDATNEVFEITLSGLTRQEAEEVLKTHGKSKSGKPVFQSTKQLKEIGTNSKAIVSWSFPSSSMAVNGEAILYKTQLNEDGTMSCNCMGWTRGSAKSAEGRFCKHTRAIEDQYSVKLIHTKWKQGAPLGDEFVEVKAGITKAGEVPNTPTYAAKRIVEI
jgi:hypothetical protein